MKTGIGMRRRRRQRVKSISVLVESNSKTQLNASKKGLEGDRLEKTAVNKRRSNAV